MVTEALERKVKTLGLESYSNFQVAFTCLQSSIVQNNVGLNIRIFSYFVLRLSSVAFSIFSSELALMDCSAKHGEIKQFKVACRFYDDEQCISLKFSEVQCIAL